MPQGKSRPEGRLLKVDNSVTRSEHPLERHDLPRLEAAAKELDSHIKQRRRLFRPSTPRRIIGLFFSLPAIVIGLAVIKRCFELNLLIGWPILGGLVLAIGGAIWIYSDWFE